MSVLTERAKRAGTVAGQHADQVDREARFPHEAFAALRAENLLGIMIPESLGGEAASLADILSVCHRLGQHCAATAMIYAMHQIQIACLVRHGEGAPWIRELMKRCVREQMLLASATSEAGIGGDVRSSSCAVEGDKEWFRLSKNATVISYGEHADGILVTARRHPDSPPSDQVIVAVLAEDYRLEQTGEWDTLGMRGTCSNGYWLHAEASTAQILPLPYADISAQTMLPISHLTWSGVWLGIASEAVGRARAYVRAAARKKLGSTPPGALRLSDLVSRLQLMRGNLKDCLALYEAARDQPERLTGMGFAIAMNNLKTGSSEMASRIVTDAMMICGLSGYRNDTPYSLGRQLRDSFSAALMVNNDRIHGNTANLLLVHKDEGNLFG